MSSSKTAVFGKVQISAALWGAVARNLRDGTVSVPNHSPFLQINWDTMPQLRGVSMWNCHWKICLWLFFQNSSWIGSRTMRFSTREQVSQKLQLPSNFENPKISQIQQDKVTQCNSWLLTSRTDTVRATQWPAWSQRPAKDCFATKASQIWRADLHLWFASEVCGRPHMHI